MTTSDIYPSDESLKSIREWPHDNFPGLMDFVRDLWNYSEWGFQTDPFAGEYYLSTGGWSGNEEIISSLQENGMFWSMCWESSRRGGHNIFKVRNTR